MKRTSIFAVVVVVLSVLILSFMLGVAVAQEKTKKLAPTDTLVSRTQMMAKIRNDIQRVQNEAEQTILILRGQLSALEVQTSDSIRVKK